MNYRQQIRALQGTAFPVDVLEDDSYAKYLTKELLCSAPKKSRRITCSRRITLNEKTKSDRTWSLLDQPIAGRFLRRADVAFEVKWDENEILWSFKVPNSAIEIQTNVLAHIRSALIHFGKSKREAA